MLDYIVKHSSTFLEGVQFTTEGLIDNRGIVRLHTEIKNSNYFDKKKVKVTLNVMNDGNIVYSLNTGVVSLSGTFSSLFIPTKKSNMVINKYGNMSFEYIVMDSPNAYITNEEINKLDKDITESARNIRRIKALVESQPDEETDMHRHFNELVKHLTLTKTKRGEKVREIEHNEKFASLSLEIVHSTLSQNENSSIT